MYAGVPGVLRFRCKLSCGQLDRDVSIVTNSVISIVVTTYIIMSTVLKNVGHSMTLE